MAKDKVVLAYSGGLDTSIIIHWLKENYDYDVIIIGAGNGGLSSALYLLKHGKKVLMLEKNNYPGGCATSFVKGRFEFEASLHEMCFVGSEEEPGPIRKLLNQEYNLDVGWIPVEDVFKIVCKDPKSCFDIVFLL